jgi:SagB-type dehydrogenase family enzyme
MRSSSGANAMSLVSLPAPKLKGKMSIEECLAARRSVRAYLDTPLSVADAGQLLWAAQGVTGPEKQRTAPSAGALYPLDVYFVAGNVTGLDPGVYRYDVHRHQLWPLSGGDRREELFAAAFNQDCVRYAAALLVFTATHRRTTRKYGEKAARFVDVEAGHAAENVVLQAVALGLGSVTVGAMDCDAVKRVLRPGAGEEPIYVVAVGPRTRRR